MLGERGIDVSYETERRWVLNFGPAIVARVYDPAVLSHQEHA
jgi:transposase-like protein